MGRQRDRVDEVSDCHATIRLAAPNSRQPNSTSVNRTCCASPIGGGCPSGRLQLAVVDTELTSIHTENHVG
jgi:hypothetical protein